MEEERKRRRERKKSKAEWVSSKYSFSKVQQFILITSILQVISNMSV